MRETTSPCTNLPGAPLSMSPRMMPPPTMSSRRSSARPLLTAPAIPELMTGADSYRWGRWTDNPNRNSSNQTIHPIIYGRRSRMATPEVRWLDAEEKKRLKLVAVAGHTGPKQAPWPAPGMVEPDRMRGAGERAFLRPAGQTTITFNFAAGKPSKPLYAAQTASSLSILMLSVVQA